MKTKLALISLFAASALPIAVSQETHRTDPGRSIPAPRPPVATDPAPGISATFWWGDFDGDGRLDAYAVAPAGRGYLLRNLGDGSFEDVTLSAGLIDIEAPTVAAWEDFDCDGHLDIFLGTAFGPARLLRNLGNASFEPAADGVEHLDRDLRAAWIDYDGDGLPDLQVRTRERDLLYHNLGSGLLEPVELGLGDGVPSFDTPIGRPGAREGDPAEPRPGAADTPPSPPRGRTPVRPGGSTNPPARDRGPGNTGGTPLPPHTPSSDPIYSCPEAIIDQVDGLTCIPASSEPTLGMFYPMSTDLNVDDQGKVNMGTITSSPYRLNIAALTRHISMTATGANADVTVLGEPAGTGGLKLNCIGGGEFISFLNSGGETLRIDTAGNIGIGTDSPEIKLHVEGGSYINSSSGGYAQFGSSSSYNVAIDQNEIQARTNGTPSPLFLNFRGGDLQVGTTCTITDSGRTGIGTLQPSHRLTVQSTDAETMRLIGPGSYGTGARLNWGDSDFVYLEEDSDDHLSVYAKKGTRISSTWPSAPGLSVQVNAAGNTAGPAVEMLNWSTGDGIAFTASAFGTATAAQINNRGSGPHIRCSAGGGVNVFEVQHSGRVVTTALQITGGGDLVEGFETAEDNCEPGSVVVIDPDHAGQLLICAGPYDSKVAGIVSGAGGVAHGIQMGQDGVIDGDTLVAMTGRVYAKCTAENGPIRPGDLLTTSSLTGHAMKATDPERSFGSVIGKAMSSLDEDTGLVLILVNLQ